MGSDLNRRFLFLRLVYIIILMAGHPTMDIHHTALVPAAAMCISPFEARTMNISCRSEGDDMWPKPHPHVYFTSCWTCRRLGHRVSPKIIWVQNGKSFDTVGVNRDLKPETDGPVS